MSTVQLVANHTLPSNDPLHSNFAPGRGLSPLCLDLPIDIDLHRGGHRGGLQLQDCRSLNMETGYASGTSASSSYQDPNKSEASTTLSTPKGWLIVPANSPADMDFDATTFGSLTQCKAATSLCDMECSRVERSDAHCLFDCERDRAGLDLKGNLSALEDSSFSQSYMQRGFAIADYTNSSMTSLNDYNNLNPGPTRWQAILLEVQMRIITNYSILSEVGSIGDRMANEAYSPLVGPYGDDERVSGILSCTTTLSDVVRSVFDSIPSSCKYSKGLTIVPYRAIP